MGWLVGWLIFGALAAYESGALALNAGGDWGPMRALAYIVASIGCLGVIAMRAVNSRRASRLRTPWVLCIAVLAVCLWDIYGSTGGAWITVAMFGTVFAMLCLVALSVAMLMAHRRHRAHEARVAHEMSQRERHRRMDALHTPIPPLPAGATFADADPMGLDSDFTLPARPKWEES